ncbi:GrpB family protein [Streptomyces sp. NPDC056601]|uniref:GrpB family protein n=1 Tax=Streptomyces sp. NPDC056601 TaxID=3345875 RepID=UPI0036CC23F3
MPFPYEIGPVMVLDHRPQWPPEFEQLAGQLRAAMGGVALDIDHVGSTAVPGLAAKDCIDVQIRVRSIDEGERSNSGRRRACPTCASTARSRRPPPKS